MDVLLRPAVAEDLMGVGALHHSSRLAAYRHFIPVAELTAATPGMLGQWWAERWPYERETHLMTVAERAGQLVGFTYVGPYQHPDEDNDPSSDPSDAAGATNATNATDAAGTTDATDAGTVPDQATPALYEELGELYAIHLDPAEQGQGVGRLLMTDALATLRRRGWRQAGLWVYEQNAHARRFYERGGWRLDGAWRDGSIGATVSRQLYYRRPLP